MKRTIVILLLFTPFVIRAGCPMPGILTICEVETADRRTMQGIIYLYKGEMAGIMAPNGFYESFTCDTTAFIGRIHNFDLKFRGMEVVMSENGPESFELFYAHSLFAEERKGYRYDTIRNRGTLCCLFHLDFEYYKYMFPGQDSVYSHDGKKVLIPVSNSHYIIDDTLSIYEELEEYKPCAVIIPMEKSVVRIPMRMIRSLRIITKPDKTWLNKIKCIEGAFRYNRTLWLHEILASKRSIRDFLSLYLDNLLEN